MPTPNLTSQRTTLVLKTLALLLALFCLTPSFANDLDNDGIPDAVEGDVDSDGDGIPDNQDDDSDNDGIPDSVEAGANPESPVDSDGDGIPNYLDLDSDADGIPDELESPLRDTDDDGIPDGLDPDSDNDTIPDSVEGLGNVDNDILPNYRDWDSDEDGIPDIAEVGPDPYNPLDSDGDGIPNYEDKDSDDDGIPDSVEQLNDADFDGIFSYLDTDSDNDGIPDSVEGTADNNNNGIPDYIEYTLTDADIDTDGDGVNDADDWDDDNDGYLDFQEQSTVDTDGDGLVDSRDIDSDNDGICDLYEGGGFDDNGDCRHDLNGGESGIPLVVSNFPNSLYDQDLDGIPSVIDLDSDGDGLWDLTENGQFDIDNNGLIDRFFDDNSDGADDTTPYVILDLDADFVPDYVDSFIGTELGPDTVVVPDAGIPEITTLQSPAAFETSVDGIGGCTIGTGAKDPTLLLLLLGITLLYVSRRNRRVLFLVIPLFTSACTITNNPGTFKQSLYFHLGSGASRLQPEPLSTASVSDNQSSASTFTLGADLTRDFSIEISTHTLGEATISPAGSIDYRVSPSVSLVRYAFGSVQNQRLRVGLSGFGRLGAALIQNEATVPIQQDNETSVLFGLGVEYIFRNGIGLRTEVQAFDSDVQSLTAGFTYRFGPRPRKPPVVNHSSQKVPIEPPKKVRTPPKWIPRKTTL